MGFDTTLNAIPPHCALLERIADKQIDAELLIFVRSYFHRRRGRGERDSTFTRGIPEYEKFVDALEAMMVTNPGIENRYCDLERRFDWLKWLLERCAQDEYEQLLAATAIAGTSQILPSAKSTQGFKTMWTLPDDCGLIHLWLDEITVSDLKSKYNPAQMRYEHLYKFSQHSESEDEVIFEWIANDFIKLKKLYGDVVARDEAILVVCD
jgi:Domain of unknown function (DUF1877)